MAPIKNRMIIFAGFMEQSPGEISWADNSLAGKIIEEFTLSAKEYFLSSLALVCKEYQITSVMLLVSNYLRHVVGHVGRFDSLFDNSVKSG